MRYNIGIDKIIYQRIAFRYTLSQNSYLFLEFCGTNIAAHDTTTSAVEPQR